LRLATRRATLLPFVPLAGYASSAKAKEAPKKKPTATVAAKPAPPSKKPTPVDKAAAEKDKGKVQVTKAPSKTSKPSKGQALKAKEKAKQVVLSKKEKEQEKRDKQKEKKEKLKETEKERENARKEKERAKALKLKEQKSKKEVREKEVAQRKKEKEQQRKQRERQRQEDKKRAEQKKLLRVKERAKKEKQKEKEKLAKEKEQEKSKKKKRHPDAPKKPASMFALFVKETSLKLSQGEFKGKPAPEVMKVVAQRWSALDDGQKQKYETLVNKDKARYEKELKEFKEKHPDPPKRPISAYILYSNANRDQIAKANPDKPIYEIAKLIGGKWNKLTDNEKKKYFDQQAKLKAAYLKEIDAFRQKYPEHAE